MLKIHEVTRDDGSLEPIRIARDPHGSNGDLLFVRGEEALALPHGAIEKVMTRYGTPLEPDEVLVEVAALDLDGGARLRHVRHRGFYDVIARDWLVYEAPGSEPLCVLATAVAAALEHLARA